ncbi:MAG TPA: histidine phosphatase family protein [Marmoricola sp.]|jgi:probable phosphoglycerate mutase|nr:histidine phosphatase family protein [Marmoricola sp.]
MRLLLLRHGQTHGNTAGALDTAVPGLDLTDLGHRQAAAAARAIGEDGIDQIFVSTLTRTRQTAEPLARQLGLEIRALDGLREISAGDFEMGEDHDSIAGYIGTVADWIEGRHDTRMPGGETGHEFLARYDAAVAEIHRSVVDAGHERALLVSHGAAIRTWVSARVPDVEAHAKATDPLHNTACITLVGDPESGWEIEAWSSDPVGGAFLDDASAPDPTGQATDGAVEASGQAQN